MKIYTAHLRPHGAPVLVREGFSWAALLFGPLWLAAHRAWVAAALALAAGVVLCAPILDNTVLGNATPLLLLALAWALGLWGQDIRRWSLERRGFLLAHIIAAPDADAALARLLARRPDLIPAATGAALR